MKLSQLLRVHGLDQVSKEAGGVVVISAQHPEPRGVSWIEFLGASCVASVIPGTDDLNSITVRVPPGDGNQVVALRVFGSEPKAASTIFRVLIGIVWVEEKLVIDFDAPFISSPGVLGQVVHKLVNRNGLMVTFGDQRFSSHNFEEFEEVGGKRVQKPATDYAIVPDANLLCRFLVGQATLQEVQKAVTKKPVDVGDLQWRVNHLEQVDDFVSDQLEEARKKIADLENDLVDAEGVRARLVESHKNTLQTVLERSKVHWGQRKKALRSISEFVEGLLSIGTR